MADITRALTAGEIALLSSVFSKTISYSKVKVHNYKAYFSEPDDTAMTPDGEMYFPPAHFKADFSAAGLSNHWSLHEGAHLYRVLPPEVEREELRGIFDRNYDYTLSSLKKFKDYGFEQQGDIAEDFYKLKQGATISKPYKLSDYSKILPV